MYVVIILFFIRDEYMASVQIEQRKLKSGKISFKITVKVTKRKKVIERVSQTFDKLKLAERWPAKSKKALEQIMMRLHWEFIEEVLLFENAL
jgi:hypothetical protein